MTRMSSASRPSSSPVRVVRYSTMLSGMPRLPRAEGSSNDHQGLSHGTHVVNAKNGGPARHRDEACCNGTAETALRGDWIQGSHERFPARSPHHAGPGSAELGQAAEELQAPPRGLREPEARVEQG